MAYEFTEEYILPVKIAAHSGNIENAEALLKAKPLQIALKEYDCCSVFGKGYIILDFGMEYHGGARILTYWVQDQALAPVRLRFGESLSETCSEIGEKGSCNDHAVRDMKAELPFLSDMVFGRTGFRFLRVDFLSDKRVDIKNIYCEYRHRIFPEHAPFKTEDARINEIFQTAKRTIELCCQNFIWDGIKRDRLVWVGDMHPETLALTSLYGRCELIENTMDFITGETPIDRWMNEMPMYSAWWLIISADYCKIAKVPFFAQKHANYILAQLKKTDGCVKDNGELDFPSYFVDWPTHEQEDELSGCRAILIIMANKMAAFEGIPGLEEVKAIAERLHAKLIKKPITVKRAKQVAALKYLALGDLEKEDVELITRGCAKGMSTFMSYYILKAVAEKVSPEKAVEMMKEYYGAMLDLGATAFFEDFDMEWVENSCRLDEFPNGKRDIHGDFGKFCYTGFRHSFCHGWSAGVIRFIYEYCNEFNSGVSL